MLRRCINSDGLPSLPGRDVCGPCFGAAEAKRKEKIRRDERRRTRRKYVSLSAAVYARLDAEAAKRGQSIRSLLEEVLA